MRDIEFRVHPSDEELASFIDNRLEGEAKEKLKRHIVKCNRCRLSIVGAIKEKRKKLKYSNNIFYIGAIVASIAFIIFVPMFEEQTHIKSLAVSKVSLFDMIIEWLKSIF